MPKEKVLVVGLGEVGRPIFELLKESGKFDTYGYDVEKPKMADLRGQKLPDRIDTMHICLPCGDPGNFVETTKAYIRKYRPRLTIINSTVPPQTTKIIGKQCKNCLIAHSPIRGVHKSLEHMKWEIKRWTKYVGGANEEASEAACKHFERMGLNTRILGSSTETELAKLFETTYRAWIIVCFQEMHRIALQFNADFDNAVEFLEDTHRVRLDRPVMFPGEIGGHCLIPNVKLLESVYDSKLLRLILESNEKRETEMHNKQVFLEAEKIRKRAERLEREIAEKIQALPDKTTE